MQGVTKFTLFMDSPWNVEIRTKFPYFLIKKQFTLSLSFSYSVIAKWQWPEWVCVSFSNCPYQKALLKCSWWHSLVLLVPSGNLQSWVNLSFLQKLYWDYCCCAFSWAVSVFQVQFNVHISLLLPKPPRQQFSLLFHVAVSGRRPLAAHKTSPGSPGSAKGSSLCVWIFISPDLVGRAVFILSFTCTPGTIPHIRSPFPKVCSKRNYVELPALSASCRFAPKRDFCHLTAFLLTQLMPSCIFVVPSK